jgi:2'-5' RNA ligase
MKAYAIEVFFEYPFDQYVRDLWRRCDQEQVSTFMESLDGVEPHIALARYDDVDSEKLEQLFREFIKTEISRFELYFDSVSVFPITKVTYLQPNVSRELSALMNMVHNYFKIQCSPFYTENRWFPHVSIAKNNTNEELKTAVNFIVDYFVPHHIKVTRIGLVEISKGSCKTLISKDLI